MWNGIGERNSLLRRLESAIYHAADEGALSGEMIHHAVKLLNEIDVVINPDKRSSRKILHPLAHDPLYYSSKFRDRHEGLSQDEDDPGFEDVVKAYESSCD